MQKFISIPTRIVEIESSSKFNLSVIYATIKNHIPNDKLEVQVYYSQLEKETGLGIATIKRLVPILQQNGLIMDIFKSNTSASGTLLDHRCSIYKFKDDMKSDYIMINPDFLKLVIPCKIKGFILMLRAICRNGANWIKIGTSEQMSKKIGCSKNTFNKYYKELIKYNDIVKIIDDTLVFNSKYFYLNNPNNSDSYSFLYNTIWTYCYDKNTIPPVKHNGSNGKDKSLELMVLQLAGKEINLEEKIPTLPEEITLEYFLKALCNDTHKIKKQTYTFIL